ncbi:T9SS type A sorting domain-containing protein [Flavobacteriales bacterium]|jgi:hypothetical protein|nr:T9SS type A sorting domain-containing protein [Pelagibacterales bacterium]MBL6874677.1 T9SS type A sorting domain-containing protein [Flavobacteriales bacterium]MDC1063906.1 T9SS type A sorting domain-containing protein [Flavobacteriales bacterium]|tara:strand:+ start:247 stop:993 length:747 start_codon:yes stop_codon:yes gene_type:complete
MKKHLLFIICLLLLAFNCISQNATNFITDDCNGISHNLFDELDNGEVIVLAWVMPCGPCATYAGYAATAVESFAISHPGKVKFYMVDDFANSNCQYLSSWATNYHISTDAIFSSSDINMNDYGGPGMPKVVVIGKYNYSIYYNGNNTSITKVDVSNAINLALSESTLNINNTENIYKLFPNPTSDYLSFTVPLKKDDQIEIFNNLGGKISDFNFSNNFIDVSNLETGMYFLKITSEKTKSVSKFMINK